MDTEKIDISPKINYEKSLQKQRLVYKVNAWLIIATIIYYSLFCGIAALLSALFFSHFYRDALVIKITCLVIFIWMISSIFFNNRLVKIERRNRKPNKNDILETMNEFFPRYNFIVNNKQMMRSLAYSRGLYPMRNMVTILFDDNLMYLNITTLGSIRKPTFMHGILNYIKAKKIAAYIKYYYGS